MRFLSLVAGAASLGAAAAGVIQAKSNEDTCANVINTGEVLHLSVNIVEYPVIVDVELEEDAVVTIDNTILIECTNAPTHLHTTVYAFETKTVTKTISTATVTGKATGEATATQAAASNENGHTVITKIATKTKTSNAYVDLDTQLETHRSNEDSVVNPLLTPRTLPRLLVARPSVRVSTLT